MSDRFRTKKVYECKHCGKEWDVPGAAELCWKKDELLNKLQEVENHKQFYLDDVIEDIEQKIEQREYDYDNS